MNSVNVKFCLAVFIVAALAGCGRGAGKSGAGAARPADAGTIRSEVVRNISGRVIGEIPVAGRLGEIKKRGILRVALPPAEPPFQSLDKTLNLPVGFNPALVAEIALILEVKPNTSILDRQPDPRSYPADWTRKYDLVFLPETAAGCPPKQNIPYFYAGAAAGWKTICAADPDGGFSSAVREILIYLNETGIFAQLYRTHVVK